MEELKTFAQIEWEGIKIEVRFTQNWLCGTAHHLELKADEPLSVTTTGYRSHFLPPEFDVDMDFVLAFVAEWLADAAQSREWQDRVERKRQGDLFDL